MQTNIINGWFYITIFCALMDWWAISQDRFRFRYITKPLVLLFLMIWFSTNNSWKGLGLFFGLALSFSFIGDIFLLKGLVRKFPAFFQFGLIAFLAAQISYLVGFTLSGMVNIFPMLTIIVMVAYISVSNSKNIFINLRTSREGKKLTIPILIYITALSLMLISAILSLFRSAWHPAAALLVSLGAILFYISDSILAHDKFGAPLRGSELVVTVTYHLGQLAIIAGYFFK